MASWQSKAQISSSQNKNVSPLKTPWRPNFTPPAFEDKEISSISFFAA